MASGYDIGVSASTANSFSTPQTTDAGTVFNFSSPGASGDWYQQDQKSQADATAVATSKSPGASSSVGTPGSISGDGSSSGGSSVNLAMVGVVLSAVALAFVLFKK